MPKVQSYETLRTSLQILCPVYVMVMLGVEMVQYGYVNSDRKFEVV